MTKANITQYDSTASNNTDIDGVDISEGCSPSGINNSIRSLMSHLKNVDTGTQALTALSVTGNVSVGGTFTSRGIDDNADALAITIDNSENVFVTKTSSDVAVVGQELRSSGFFASTRDGATVSALTRLSSDGTILEFRKDSSAVGSIATQGSHITIGSNNTGLRFKDSVDAIQPQDITGASGRDNAIDLGTSGARFNNLYLSGGVFLGGTGSANELHIYEEGSWTMRLSDGTNTAGQTTGYYTKIGDRVFINGFIGNISTSGLTANQDLRIVTLPFTASSSKSGLQRTIGTISVDGISFVSDAYLTLELGHASGTELRIMENRTGNGSNRMLISEYTSGSADIWIQGVYTV